MDTNRLRELATDPALVPGIYAHCDRWCEKCASTDRCLHFKWEAESRRASDDCVPVDGASSASAGEPLAAAVGLLGEIAEEGDVGGAASEDGAAEAIPCGEPDVFFPAPEPDEVELVARAAFEYAGAVDAWFVAASGALRAKADELTAAVEADRPGDPAGEACRIHAALETAQYYHHFIPLKLMRAVTGVPEMDEPGDVEAVPGDADGSVKVALLAMDRSLEAWRGLRRSLPDQGPAIAGLITCLRDLRRETEARFPAARAFVRAGLDEPKK